MNGQVVHRPGPFKQKNKPHKLERGKCRKINKGRLSAKSLSKQKKHELSREERKNQMNQIRKMKKDENMKQKRSIGHANTPPIIVLVLGLNESNTQHFMDELTSCDDQINVNFSKRGHCHISSFRLKQRFTFLMPSTDNIHSLMDAVKVAETLLLLHTPDVIYDNLDTLLSVLMSHSLPTTVHVIQGVNHLNPKKKAEIKKNILKNIESKFPDSKLHHADTRSELQLLLRQIGCQKQRPVAFRDARFHMLAEETELIDLDTVSGKGILKVSGYIRGKPIDVNSLVHIPGWGTYQMKQLVVSADPFEDDKRKQNIQFSIASEPDPLKQESLQSEVEVDPMEGEQTWPTQEELDAVDLQPKKVVRKVAEGISEYQAAWIVESENEDSCSESDEESDMETAASVDEKNEDNDIAVTDQDTNDTESVFDVKDENYDENMDMDEENRARVRFQDEQMNLMFPDEYETPRDAPMRIQLQKYRGLQSFKNSPWDPMENLPQDYARIYRFEHFRQTKKKVLKNKDEIGPEIYVTLFIKDVPCTFYETSLKNNTPIVVYGLLPHEQKMSLINTVIRKHHSCTSTIKSKDKLIFHIGYARFTCNPIFSEHTTGGKYKHEKYLMSDASIVASFYAPVIFPPAPVVVFRLQSDGTHKLVATGSVLDVNPNRVIVKRKVLTGHPFRIYKRIVIVRYMFCNKEDINWFKCVELHTRCGRRGHITESLGTRGHMKCVFDRQLQSQDVALMSLYKRVFPKWTYECYNPSSEKLLLSDFDPTMQL